MTRNITFDKDLIRRIDAIEDSTREGVDVIVNRLLRASFDFYDTLDGHLFFA